LPESGTPEPAAPAGPRARLAAWIGARPRELAAAWTGFAVFFCLFAGYFMLRPIRETMGIAAGVGNLQWLFTATFLVMLAAVPAHGWLSSRVPRARLANWVYGFFIANLLAFALLFHALPDSVWAARVFYVWISVYNLFVVSMGWSIMADVFDAEQARRMFAFIAAGASVGGLTGPAAGALLAGMAGQDGLILIAALLLAAAVAGKTYLMRWRAVAGAGRPDAARDDAPARPIGGSPWAGIVRVARSPQLLGIAAFVILLATVSTFLYFEQARLVAAAFPQRAQQIRVFGAIDFAVQALSLLAQAFVAGRVAARWGLRPLLAAVPALMVLAFLALALWPQFAVLAAAMIVRRVGEYAFVKPGREMLFAAVDPEAKYKAKNFIDTVVYRAGDAMSGWAKAWIDGLAQGGLTAALAGAGCAAAWAVLGYWLGRRRDAGRESPAVPARRTP